MAKENALRLMSTNSGLAYCVALKRSTAAIPSNQTYTPLDKAATCQSDESGVCLKGSRSLERVNPKASIVPEVFMSAHSESANTDAAVIVALNRILELELAGVVRYMH